jgi:hypothetical protein
MSNQINNYNDIDFCLNILYNFIYTKSSTCYEFKYEAKKDIDIRLLKKGPEFNHTNILSNLTFISPNNKTLIFKRNSESGYSSMIRVGVYSEDNKNVNDQKRKEIIDMHLNYIFTDLVINDPFKFILLPIFNFDIKYSELLKNHKNILDELSVLNINKNSIFYFQVFEHYFKMQTLNDFLYNNYTKFTSENWKILCFQILQALYKIQKSYANFRHNKLDFNSIFVYYKKETDKVIISKIDNLTFEIPNVNFEIKLTNFYDSTIPNYINSNTNKKNNPYYDIYYIFTNLLNFTIEYKINDFNLLKFLDDIVQKKFRIKNSENKYNLELDESYYEQNIVTILNPYIILSKNNFFIDLIMKGKKNILSDSSEGSIDYVLSSSMTETGFGEVPIMLAKKQSKNMSGIRQLATHNNTKKTISGGSALDFDMYGRLIDKDTGTVIKNMDGGKKKTTHKPSKHHTRAVKHKKAKKVPEYDVNDDEEDSEDDVNDVDVNDDTDGNDSDDYDNNNDENDDDDDVDEDQDEEDTEDQEDDVQAEDELEGDLEDSELDDITESATETFDESGGSKFVNMLHSNYQNPLLSKLPANYEGLLPDWAAQQMNNPTGQNNNMIPPDSIGQNMNQTFNNMMQPNMGQQSFGNMMPQNMEYQMPNNMGQPNGNMDNMFNSLRDMNAPAPAPGQPDHTDQLPPHMLMNQQQMMGPNMQQFNQPPMAQNMQYNPQQAMPQKTIASCMGHNPAQQGGKKKQKNKKNFFF